jgi:hypothetical protein
MERLRRSSQIWKMRNMWYLDGSSRASANRPEERYHLNPLSIYVVIKQGLVRASIYPNSSKQTILVVEMYVLPGMSGFLIYPTLVKMTLFYGLTPIHTYANLCGRNLVPETKTIFHRPPQ